MSRGIGINVPCEWCQGEAEMGEHTVYWELPDGTRAVEITKVPSVNCPTCGMIYSSDEVTKEIEDQLLLVATKNITRTIKYKDLMTLPRLLKRNYFDFTS